jgi:hypothetical protein
MNGNQFKTLSESLAGLLTVQSLLFQYLIKTEIIKKDDIANALDFLIDDFNRHNPSQGITLPMKRIRDSLEKVLPDFSPPPPEPQRPKSNYPDWLHGILEGGKK